MPVAPEQPSARVVGYVLALCATPSERFPLTRSQRTRVCAASMATGDLHNNAARLASELRRLRYPSPRAALSAADLVTSEAAPRLLLPAVHWLLLDFSPHVARRVAAAGVRLFALDDAAL